MAMRHLSQFHRRATDVTHQTVRLRPAQQDTLRRKPRLLLAADALYAQPGHGLNLGDKGVAIHGLAHGGGGHGHQW